MPVMLDAKTRTFLNAPHAAVLATVSPRGRPQATPVWFLVEDGDILINTSRGRVKLTNMEANPYVSLSIVDSENMYRYVQVRGRVVGFDAANGARDIDRLSVRYTGQPYRYPGGQRPADRVSVRITPISVSGMG